MKLEAKSNFLQNANGRLPFEDGSDRGKTLGKRVSDDLEHFIFQRRKKKINLGVGSFFNKLAFWRSYDCLSVTGRLLVKSNCL